MTQRHFSKKPEKVGEYPMSSADEQSFEAMVRSALRPQENDLDERIEKALDRCAGELLSEDEARRIVADATKDTTEVIQGPIEGDNKDMTPEITLMDEVRAVASKNEYGDIFGSRLSQFAPEKQFIAVFIAEMLNHDYQGEALALDGGTTNSAIAAALGHQALAKRNTIAMIITNNTVVPKVVSRGYKYPEVRLTGGLYRADHRTLIGGDVISVCQKHAFAVSVVGANGFEFPNLCTNTGTENEVKNAFIQSAKTVIFPIDPSKCGVLTGMKLVDLEELAREGKRVLIVTAYPISLPETRGRCLRYRQRLSEEIVHLLTEWKYDKEIRLVKVDLSDYPEKRAVLRECTENEQFDPLKLDETFEQLNSHSSSNIGLVIAFDLWYSTSRDVLGARKVDRSFVSIRSCR